MLAFSNTHKFLRWIMKKHWASATYILDPNYYIKLLKSGDDMAN